MQMVSLKDVSKETKILLLQELGFGSDGIFVLDSDGKRYRDKYSDEDVKIDNMAILPGSCVILDDNPLSISGYQEEYGDIL